ncbi:hypothetical protein Scep_006686 [Stephania cephalantha]|uniref:Uncharacterized protein n=1 Tax=Stephania cephalantha TaxID=152367 RepID=A0AAP0KA01_9MAGN
MEFYKNRSFSGSFEFLLSHNTPATLRSYSAFSLTCLSLSALFLLFVYLLLVEFSLSWYLSPSLNSKDTIEP